MSSGMQDLCQFMFSWNKSDTGEAADAIMNHALCQEMYVGSNGVDALRKCVQHTQDSFAKFCGKTCISLKPVHIKLSQTPMYDLAFTTNEQDEDEI